MLLQWLILPIQNDAKNLQNDRNPGTWVYFLRALSESYPMNANMAGFNGFSKNDASCAFDESSLSIERVQLHKSVLSTLQKINRSRHQSSRELLA